MSSLVQSWRSNKQLAYIMPFVLFMLAGSLTGFFKVENPSLPWWKAGPEHWVYPIQTVLALAAISFWWKCYDFRPLPWRFVWLAAAAAIVGMILWFLPNLLWQKLGIANWGWPDWLLKTLGLVDRSAPGFDPDLLKANSTAHAASITMRFVRAVIAVPILEELMWRGFLWRWLADPDRDFWNIPIGIWNLRAIAISIGVFVLGHGQVDWLGCLIYGMVISWLAVRTRSLGACVVCHAISNLILCIYVLATRQFGYW